MTTYVIEQVDPRQLNSVDNRLGVYWSGSLGWLSWALQPTTWLLFSIPLVGVGPSEIAGLLATDPS